MPDSRSAVHPSDIVLKGRENFAFDGEHSEQKNQTGFRKLDSPLQTTNNSDTDKYMMLKNLLVIGFGFLLNFTAFNALANIQSSLNSDEGLGTTSMSVIYGALIISCMFVPAAIIKRLGCKWTMVVSMLMYTTYIAANLYANWYTMIPSSILLGLGAAPLWSAKCTYLTQIGHQYAEIVGEKVEVVVVRFFGIFFMLFQTSQIWGNLISSLVLSPGDDKDNVLVRNLSICGAQYCNEDLATAIERLNTTSPNATNDGSNKPDNKPDMSQIYMLCGIYGACSIAAVLLIATFVNPLKQTTTIPSEKQDKKELTGLNLLVATFHHMKDYRQVLLIPLTIFSGVEQAFLAGDFTKAFINCSMGIHNVGYVMICAGVVDAICSLTFGPLVKILGRMPLYVFGAALNLLLAIIMLMWHPDPNTPAIFFVITGLWGMADAIWQTQINAFYGVLFSDNTEAAFANYRLWESVGFILGFAWNTYLCIHVKLYLVLAILIVGMLGYFCIEATKHLHQRTAHIARDN